MAVHGAYSAFLSLCRRHHHRCNHSFVSSRLQTHHSINSFLFYLTRNRPLTTSAESVEPSELSGKNAYDLLGLSESCSFSEIKASFRRLAKETHPDLTQSPDGFSNSNRFVQILAAYEILSDAEKRAHYDKYLFSQKIVIQKHTRQGSQMYTYESYEIIEKQMEVVEWLKWYRDAINGIVSEKRIMDGTGYFDVLQSDFYSAINAAYYGHLIQSMDFLPDCFEADVRSVPGTPEVLHLVSGRDLFGKVCIAKKVLELSHGCYQDSGTQIRNYDNHSDHTCDAYKDLELHVSGKMVAVAKRVPPKSYTSDTSNEDCEDRIHVYLNVHEEDHKDACEEDAIASKVFL